MIAKELSLTPQNLNPQVIDIISQSEKSPLIAIVATELTVGHPDYQAGLDMIQKVKKIVKPYWLCAMTTHYEYLNIAVAALKAGANDCISTKWPGVNWEILLTKKIEITKEVSREETYNH